MNGWLLDTDVISELRKKNCDEHVALWASLQPETTLFLSVISVAEIRTGIERSTSEARQQELSRWLDTLRTSLQGRILGIDEEAMIEWIRLVRVARGEGYVFAQPDLFVATIAKTNKLCVVTRNTAHFTRAGVPLFNPWTNALSMPDRPAVRINGPVMLDRLR